MDKRQFSGLGCWKLLESWSWWDERPVLASCLHHMTIDPVLGCSQAVPLVPLTEETEEAMENEQFQQLLRKLGVRPPASGQVNTLVPVSATGCCCYLKICLFLLVAVAISDLTSSQL